MGRARAKGARLKVIVRPFTEADAPFIHDSWAKNAFFALQLKVDKATWFKWFHDGLNVLLPLVQIRVAALEEFPDTILGYAVFKGPELIFRYVKKDYRSSNIEELLTPEVSHERAPESEEFRQSDPIRSSPEIKSPISFQDWSFLNNPGGDV